MLKFCKEALLLVLLVVSHRSYSQSKEYIVTAKGDTLFGETRLPIAFGKPKYKDFVMFTENGKEERKVMPSEIAGYVESGIEYLSLGAYGGGIFRRSSNGPVYIVDWYESTGSAPVMHSSGGMTSSGGGSSKVKGLYRLGSKPVGVTRFRFVKVMTEYFKDYTELAQKIANKELRYRDLEKIVEIYNSYVHQGKLGN